MPAPLGVKTNLNSWPEDVLARLDPSLKRRAVRVQVATRTTLQTEAGMATAPRDRVREISDLMRAHASREPQVLVLQPHALTDAPDDALTGPPAAGELTRATLLELPHAAASRATPAGGRSNDRGRAEG